MASYSSLLTWLSSLIFISSLTFCHPILFQTSLSGIISIKYTKCCVVSKLCPQISKEQRNPEKMAITKRTGARNVVEERPGNQNKKQTHALEGESFDDLDLAQTVRILMERQKITEETQRLMWENQRTLETQLQMTKLDNERLKSKMQEWSKIAKKTLTDYEVQSTWRGGEPTNAQRTNKEKRNWQG